jgi:hypothetical protein
MSKLPLGHYTNMVDAIKKLAAAHEAAAEARRLASDNNHARKQAAYRDREDKLRIEAGINAAKPKL